MDVRTVGEWHPVPEPGMCRLTLCRLQVVPGSTEWDPGFLCIVDLTGLLHWVDGRTSFLVAPAGHQGDVQAWILCHP